MTAGRLHRKLIKHYHEPGDLHELTFSCYHRLPILTNDLWRQQLSRTIDEAGRQTQIELAAFVFMPEHAHLLVVPMSCTPEIDRYLALVKQPFSKWVKQRLLDTHSRLLDRLTVQERPGKTSFRFWQEGPGYDRNLNVPSTIEAAIDYIHQNPVRRGLAMRAVDWKWSSASWYLLNPTRQQHADIPYIHGLPAGTLDK
jgi:putative transposase